MRHPPLLPMELTMRYRFAAFLSSILALSVMAGVARANVSSVPVLPRPLNVAMADIRVFDLPQLPPQAQAWSLPQMLLAPWPVQNWKALHFKPLCTAESCWKK
ncbi:MAG: hypothetical protein GC129_02375 [Proteobacteria bacterium]|nr:hypothetical protein [Pseudomonadota bacterium]